MNECDAVDFNLAAYLRYVTACRGGTVAELPNAFAFAAPIPINNPMMHGCFPLDANAPVDGVVEAAKRFFAGRTPIFYFWARDSDLELRRALRGHSSSTLPGIAGDRPLSRRAEDLRLLNTSEEAREYLCVLEDAWKTPAGTGELAFFPPEALLNDDVIAVGGFDDGRMVAGAMCFLTGEIAGIYWCASRPSVRRHGLGTACAIEARHYAAERGARLIVGQASREGLPLWQRLGWQVVQTYHRYVIEAE